MVTEINPEEINRPQNRSEKILSFFSKNSTSKGLVERLKTLDTTINDSGEKREVTLDDIGLYIEGEKAYFVKYCSDEGVRYSRRIENSRRRVLKMEELINEKNYLPLIRIFMNMAIREWEIADRKDKRQSEWSDEDKETLKRLKQNNDEEEAKITAKEKAVGHRLEHGIPSEFLELGGNRNRQESAQFLCFAAVLAKASSGK